MFLSTLLHFPRVFSPRRMPPPPALTSLNPICSFHALFSPSLLKLATILVQNWLDFYFSQHLHYRNHQNRARTLFSAFCLFSYQLKQCWLRSVGVYSLTDVQIYRDLHTRLASCDLQAMVCKALIREGFSNILIGESIF